MYIVIAGGGKIGTHLAAVLLEAGHEVAVIEEDSKRADFLSATLEGRYLIINGDGCDSRYQEDAGIRGADVFVAATPKDDTNLVSCEIAQRVFRCPRCVARINYPNNVRIFREIGVECVSVTSLIVNMIEEEALLGSMSVVSSLTQGDITLAELMVHHMRHNDDEEGVELGAVTIPPGARVVAVASGDEVSIATPDLTIYPGDRLIVAAYKEDLEATRQAIRAL